MRESIDLLITNLSMNAPRLSDEEKASFSVDHPQRENRKVD